MAMKQGAKKAEASARRTVAAVWAPYWTGRARMNGANPLFPPGHVRRTPLPEALRPYKAAPVPEQVRRVRSVLEELQAMYVKRTASLSGCLFLVERAELAPGCALGARRVLRAVAGTTDLKAWEGGLSREEISEALEAAIAHCEPDKRRWLAAVPQGGGR